MVESPHRRAARLTWPQRRILHGRRGFARALRAAGRGGIDVYNSDNLTYGAFIAYYTLLSCFPFLLLVLVALGMISVGSEGASRLEVIVRALPAQFDFLVGQVLELDHLRTQVTVAGTLLTLWASMGVFGA